MKKFILGMACMFLAIPALLSQSTDFVQGWQVLFEDNFEIDPVGDFPARWSTSGSGEVVQFDNVPGKWLKISQPSAVSPEMLKALPENCTIEFDLYLPNTSGVAPHIMFGLTSLSDVAAGDVYRRHISVKLMGYNDAGRISYGKNIEDMGEKDFPLEGYVNRILHVSMSLNKTRWRVWLDDQKVVDLPKLLTPDYRKNFFVASSVVIPSPEESVYISNIRIGAGEADARSLLIKQLMEQGSVVTSDIQFNQQNNELTAASYPLMDQLGQTMQQNPDMNIEINSMEEIPYQDNWVEGDSGNGADAIINKEALKRKADKIKSYLVNKFKIKVDRILTNAKAKMAEKADGNKTVSKAKKLLTEFVKL